MSVAHHQLIPGTVIVFEGLDKAGKSTQLERLRAVISTERTSFVHMPSGQSDFTHSLYTLLEQHPPSSGLSRQLSHLACHSENMPTLVEAAQHRGLVLDRWWWSTMAYGWYGGDLRASGLSQETVRDLIKCIWAPIQPSLVFLFLTPHADDPNNLAGVAGGYRRLAEQHDGPVVHVPATSEAETHELILSSLRAAKLIERSRN